MIKQVKHLKEAGKYAKVIMVWYAVRPIPRKYKGDTHMTFSAQSPCKTEYSSDFATVDLHSRNIRKEIEENSQKGYGIFLSVSLSRCVFPEYLDGRYDDISHTDEIQTDENGNPILYGPNTPYIIPTISYVQFLFRKIETLLSKIDAVVITEPNFSADAGYSEAFKREWEIYYKYPWESLSKNVDTRYRAAKLKQEIIKRSILILSTLIKNHPKATKKGKAVSIYVELGGLISNYRASLISPAATASSAPFIDGFIIDPATSLSHKRVIVDGVKEHRDFETALLEYGYMGELTANTDKTIWLPHAVSSDNLPILGEESTESFRNNLVAAMMTPKIDRHAAMISPEEFFGKLPYRSASPLTSVYEVCSEAFTHIKKDVFRWEGSDDNAIGIITGDTYLFHKKFPQNDSYATAYGEDIEYASSFFGLAIPFLDMGINVKPIPAENICRTYDYLNDYNVLILSYDYFKPSNHELHYALNAWIRSGGVLVYVGDESDTFDNASEWWNTGRTIHPSPLNHLLETVGIHRTKQRTPVRRKNVTGENLTQRSVTELMHEIGEGIFVYIPANSILTAREPDYRKLVTKALLIAAEKRGITFNKKDYFSIIRGAYRAVKVKNDGAPLAVKGTLVDLLSQNLTVETQKVLHAGECGFFYDIEEKKDDDLAVIAVGAKVSDLAVHSRGLSFKACSIKGSLCPCRLYFPHSCEVQINGSPVKTTRDETKKTVFFTFEGDPEGVEVIATRIK